MYSQHNNNVNNMKKRLERFKEKQTKDLMAFVDRQRTELNIFMETERTREERERKKKEREREKREREKEDLASNKEYRMLYNLDEKSKVSIYFQEDVSGSKGFKDDGTQRSRQSPPWEEDTVYKKGYIMRDYRIDFDKNNWTLWSYGQFYSFPSTARHNIVVVRYQKDEDEEKREVKRRLVERRMANEANLKQVVVI